MYKIWLSYMHAKSAHLRWPTLYICGDRRPARYPLSLCSRDGVGSSPLSVWSRPSHCLVYFNVNGCSPSLPRVTVPIRGGLGWVASPREVTLYSFISVRLCLFHGRRMGNVLRMAFSQNRVRPFTRKSLFLCAYLLSYGLPLLLHLN